MDYATLSLLRNQHPAWRLLAAHHAPMVAAFLHRVFIAPNVRLITESDLMAALDDELFALREQVGADAFAGSARDYLNDWASPAKGWLRKFYTVDRDEPCYDLTPDAEKAITWLSQLTQRPFVGTESRLRTLVGLLKQIEQGVQTDPAKRLQELRRQRDEIDAEIARVLAGDMPMLDETAIKDRFLLFQQQARELLSDFREVEYNFRQLDFEVREKIAQFSGSRGKLLEEIFGQHDAITDSDQGRSFQAFWAFLMSPARGDELDQWLEHVLQLPAVQALGPDPRMRRIHHDWLQAANHTQRTVAMLSRQLRRFLEERKSLESRRLMELLHSIENNALAVRDRQPPGTVAYLDAMGADISLLMERRLAAVQEGVELAHTVPEIGQDEDETALPAIPVVVDRQRLRRAILRALRQRSQITLAELVELEPLQQGLAELVTYLDMAHKPSEIDGVRVAIDEGVRQRIRWSGLDRGGQAVWREADAPCVLFVRA